MFIVSIDKNIFSPNQGISLKLSICKIHENLLMASHIDKKKPHYEKMIPTSCKGKEKGVTSSAKR